MKLDNWNTQIIKMNTIINIQMLNSKLIYKEETFNELKNLSLEELENKRDYLISEYNQLIKENYQFNEAIK